MAQLQTLLAGLGVLHTVPDGSFDAATQAAVKVWQKSLGLPQDGVVRAGDVVFVPVLPSRVALDPEVVFRGASLTGGEPVLSALSAEPVFTVPATVDQAAQMPVGAEVDIASGDQVWKAKVTGQAADPANGGGNVVVSLGAWDDVSICGASCDLVPVEGQGLLQSTIVTQPTEAGVVAPAAALVSTAAGGTVVVDEAGTQHPVTIVSSAQGMSVIEGVDAGLTVRIPATQDGGDGADAGASS